MDHPLINGDPNAVIIATPNWNPGGGLGVYNNHPIAVVYFHPSWLIANSDAAAMPAYAAFNVLVPKAGPNAFVHTATGANTVGNVTMIDNPLTNGKPNAKILVTPQDVTNSHPIGVWYNGTKWGIFNQDLAPMPVGAWFHVFVLPENYPGAFVHTATTGNIGGNATSIDHPLINNNPNAIVFVTPNWNPGGVGETYNNHNIGVYYIAGRWQIFNQDLATMPTGAAFNVLIPHPNANVFIHKATTANIAGNWTTIDSPLTNNKPNAILLVTPNWNPGGVGGTYNDHPIGVYYTGNKWAIFNQDFAAMPTNAAFNVIVPRPGPDEAVFVHQTSAANTSLHVTYIDHPLTNNNPAALVLVTPNRNPGGVGGTYNNHPIGVYYTGNKWAIFNQDLAVIQIGAAFNVFVKANRVYLPLVIR